MPPKVRPNQQKQNGSLDKAKVSSKIYKCGECNEEVDDDFSIMCSRCRVWFHQNCTNLDSDEFNILARGKETIAFICEECLKQTGADSKQNTEINKKLDRIMDMFNTFKKDILQSADEKIGKAVKNIDEKISTGIDRKVKDKLGDLDKTVEQKMKDIEQNVAQNIMRKTEEKEEQDKRKHNLIIVQLPESTKEKKEEIQADDFNATHELLKKVTDDIEIEDISQPIRLGKKDDKGRPRPVKITIKSMEKKSVIMRNYWKALNEKEKDTRKRIYINNDLTPIEREEEKALREKLKEERKKNPGKELTIREIKGKKEIVELQHRGPPRIIGSSADKNN